MRYSILGKTGLKVSRLSFGASALGGVFHPVHETEAIAAVHAALDCGINYFDVAPAYGGTLSETVLGKALRGISRDRYFLSTKVGKYTQPGSYGEDTLDYSRKRIRAWALFFASNKDINSIASRSPLRSSCISSVATRSPATKFTSP